MSEDPFTMSQVFIDAYYETTKRRDFIERVKKRYPRLDEAFIEAVYLVIQFMERKL